MITDKNLEKFMRESNAIEGEFDTDDKGRLNPGDIEAARFAINADFSKSENILKLHSILGKHLNKEWVGCWRKVLVRIGNYIPPNPVLIRQLMVQFCENWDSMNAWEAHNKFEWVHPFEDLNGRVGRLLWLNKEESYNFSISFLHSYYYQTLSHYN